MITRSSGRAPVATGTSGCRCLKISRRRRFARFRVTAPPRRREAMIPSLSQSRELGRARTVMYVATTRRPCFWTSVNSPRARRRTRGPSRRDIFGWPAATSTPLGLVNAVLRGRRDGQALATLRAAALQDETAVLGRHPDEETVGAPTTTLVGLIRTLHGTPAQATCAVLEKPES